MFFVDCTLLDDLCVEVEAWAVTGWLIAVEILYAAPVTAAREDWTVLRYHKPTIPS